jgi:glycosyltransferase involved in cell wall biosynthesis
MFDEIEWLEGCGHTVAHFSTTHPANLPSPWASYFVPYLELGQAGGLSTSEKAHAMARMFYSVEAARRFDRIVSDFAPDIVHVHNIHRQISPSILAVAKRHGVPVVQSLHDYHHVCPADVLLYRGEVPCQPARCSALWYGGCVEGRCVRNSLPSSLVSAAETFWQRLGRVYERGIARFISPSRFLAVQMQAGGWTVPIDVLPNAIATSARTPATRDGFCVIGRLSHEKGVSVALEAARLAGVRLVVAGEGPLDSELRSRYSEFDFVGRLDGAGVASLVDSSLAVVVPSVWFENAPMSVLEAMSSGSTVIASDIGGIPEQLTNGVDGLLVPAGDVAALSAAMRRVNEDVDLAMALGSAARRSVAERFSPERHLEGLLRVYATVGASV